MSVPPLKLDDRRVSRHDGAGGRGWDGPIGRCLYTPTICRPTSALVQFLDSCHAARTGYDPPRVCHFTRSARDRSGPSHAGRSVRHRHCSKDVHALSNMTEREVRALFADHVGEQLCVSYRVRDDGMLSLLPDPAVVPVQALRRSRVALAAAAAATFSLAACVTASGPLEGSQDTQRATQTHGEGACAPTSPSTRSQLPRRQQTEALPKRSSDSVEEIVPPPAFRGEPRPVDFIPDGDPRDEADGPPVADETLPPSKVDQPERGEVEAQTVIPGGITVPSEISPPPDPPSEVGGAIVRDPRG